MPSATSTVPSVIGSTRMVVTAAGGAISRTRKAIGSADHDVDASSPEARASSVVPDRRRRGTVGEELRVVAEPRRRPSASNDSHEPIDERIDEQREHEQRSPAGRAASRRRGRGRAAAQRRLTARRRSCGAFLARIDQQPRRVGSERAPFARRRAPRRAEEQFGAVRAGAEPTEVAAVILDGLDRRAADAGRPVSQRSGRRGGSRRSRAVAGAQPAARRRSASTPPTA